MSTYRQTTAAALLFLAAAGAPAQVNDVDLEYWRSVQRIDTPAAYRAYLDAFPKGAFAALAKMKLVPDASGAAPARPAEAPAAAPLAGAPASAGIGALRNFSEPVADSGAFTFNLGDRLNGPGILTLGSLGAKKQLVLPEGTWVVLAAVDTKSVQATSIFNAPRANVVALTTLVAAKFAGNRLLTLLRFTGTRQIASAGSWIGLDDCDPKAGSATLQHKRSRDGLRDACHSLQVESDPLAQPFIGAEQTRSSLDKLGATFSGAALVSSFVYSESRSGYLGVTRIDWPGALLGSAAERPSAWRPEAIEASASQTAYLKSLGDWNLTYRGLVLDGFTRRFESADLVANAPRRNSAELVPAVDFEPAAPLARK